MNKIITVLSVLVLTFGVISSVSAQSDRASERATNKNKVERTENITKVNGASTKPLRVSNAKIQKLQETVTEEVEVDPDVVLEVEEIQEEQEESEVVLESSLAKVEGRPGFLKFILGPDYRNAGHVRSEIVQLRNQVAKLTRLRAKLPEESQPEVDEAINSLNAETNVIQTRLSAALEGVSLFGWLNRFLSGYVPEESILPVPTAISSPTPEATATPEASPTAEPSPSPVE